MVNFPIYESFDDPARLNPNWKFRGGATVKEGWLQLTEAQQWLTGLALLDDAFTSDHDVSIRFEYAVWLSGIKQRFPQVHLHCFSASEIIHFAGISGLSIEETIKRLQAAGLDSIPGGGAEILDDEVRHKVARLKCLTEDWINVHRTAHNLGMRTTATMMFGVGETYEHRINHFQRLYDLQEETGGFTAFIPWSFQPKNTALGGRHWDEATAVEYLKVLAISRLYLSNFENVQSSWVTQGLKVCQLGLHFGGNDVGSVMLEENVVRSAGVANCTTEEELRHMIRNAGFRPARRDTLYRQFFLN